MFVPESKGKSRVFFYFLRVLLTSPQLAVISERYSTSIQRTIVALMYEILHEKVSLFYRLTV